MLKKLIYFLIVFSQVLFQNCYCVTLVYNMRVRRSFNIPQNLLTKKSHYITTALPIVFTRESHIINCLSNTNVFENRKTGGVLLNFRYIPRRYWWLDITTGIERDSGKFCGTQSYKSGRTGFDDFVFTFGHNFLKDKTQVSPYFLFGLPARKRVNLQDQFGPFVGSRFYNLGAGLEYAYSFINKLKRSASFIMQGRFVHSFNRSWFPILPINARIQPGNFSDLLMLFQLRERRTILEFGYDLTIFSDQAIIYPTNILKTNNFIRNSGYISLNHAILKGLFNKPLIFGIGINGSKSRKFDAKTFSAWANVSLVF